MFNFTSAEKKAILFTVIVIIVSGIYQLITPHQSLKPSYDYSESDSIFRRISQDNILTNQVLSIPSKPKPEKNSVQKDTKTNYKRSTKKSLPKIASININKASEDELKKLPYIGPAKAALIIEYRNKNGNFKNIKDLTRVKGIGKKTLEKLKPYILLE